MPVSTFIPLTDVAGLDDALARSDEAPVVVFKHDPGCGFSERAYVEMLRLGVDALLLDVSRDLGVSREVAVRTGVRHESPQVLVLRHGDAAWAASHGDVTTEAVARALDRAA